MSKLRSIPIPCLVASPSSKSRRGGWKGKCKSEVSSISFMLVLVLVLFVMPISPMLAFLVACFWTSHKKETEKRKSSYKKQRTKILLSLKFERKAETLRVDPFSQ